MTAGSILESLKTVWETWNIRCLVILSLSLQAFLILVAPFRKRSANACLIFLVWSAYLLADWAAAFAVGHISSRQSDDKSGGAANENLVAFWAPFLLVHLGGPDTITAFALEDNALWLRHMLNLVFQVSAAIYVFYQTLPKNKLLIPTVLMFVAGVVKYGERTRALYLASLKRFKKSMLQKPDPGPNYAKLMDEYSSLKEAMLPAHIEIIPEPNKESKMAIYEAEDGKLDEASVVKHGYHFFDIFKGLIVDLIFTFHERRMSREFFHKRTAEDAFKVIQVELNFIYEVLYTKVVVVHSKLGYFFRFLASGIVIGALVLFTRLKKNGFHRFDVWVTYGLLYGAIGLDAIALFMLLFSDWTVATIKNSVILNKLFGKNYVAFITRMNKPTFTKCQTQPEYEVLDTPVLFRRWSETIYSYNLLSVCLDEHPKKIQKSKGCCGDNCGKIFGILLDILGKIVFYLGLPFWAILRLIASFIRAISHGLQKIFDCFSNKLGLTEVLNGNAILHYVFDGQCSKIIGKLCIFPLYILGLEISCLNWIVRALDNDFYLVDTAHRFSRALILTFNLAAESVGLDEVLDSLKYVSRNPFPKKLWEFIFDELQVKSMFAEDTEMAKEIYEARGQWVLQDSEWKKDCKEIMKYVEGVEYDRSILLWHVATELCYNTENGTEDLNREFSKILSEYMLYLLIKQPTMMSNVAGIGEIRFRDTCAEAKKFFERRGIEKENKLNDACEKILNVMTKAKGAEPIHVKGDRSKSVLFDGCILAKELRERGQEKWKIMCRVWAELLSYAASHCRAETHAQVLSKGGELVTFVWLLMAHLGIGQQFQINEGHARAKLSVGG
ncbi:uncharacterized protein LOC115739695 [Rhodamnia argentea]|uniref:Uncharacterized protein LOC115739695 n=1 Tax=Rhodamnia argentea TaxID=178133 RepID=A0A8B8P4H2_9MYRT|nr:uncharacterized protein LOC115739695 [Rhodamnia argentea]